MMPLAYQQTWQNDSARAVERQPQHLRQQQLRLLRLRIHRRVRPRLPQRLRIHRQVHQRRLLLRRRQPQSQVPRRRHRHREFELRQHRVLGRRQRLVHSAHRRFGACRAESPERRVRSANIGRLAASQRRGYSAILFYGAINALL
jgi:hypothetical protein